MNEAVIKNNVVFIAYSSKDEWYLNEIVNHLKNWADKHNLEIFYRAELLAGQTINSEISKKIAQSVAVLLLISSDFWQSIDYQLIKQELNKQNIKEDKIIPIQVRSCIIDDDFLLNKVILPKNGKAISSWSDKDKTISTVAKEIRKKIKGYQNKNKPIRESKKTIQSKNYLGKYLLVGLIFIGFLVFGIYISFSITEYSETDIPIYPLNHEENSSIWNLPQKTKSNDTVNTNPYIDTNTIPLGGERTEVSNPKPPPTIPEPTTPLIKKQNSKRDSIEITILHNYPIVIKNYDKKKCITDNCSSYKVPKGENKIFIWDNYDNILVLDTTLYINQDTTFHLRKHLVYIKYNYDMVVNGKEKLCCNSDSLYSFRLLEGKRMIKVKDKRYKNDYPLDTVVNLKGNISFSLRKYSFKVWTKSHWKVVFGLNLVCKTHTTGFCKIELLEGTYNPKLYNRDNKEIKKTIKSISIPSEKSLTLLTIYLLALSNLLYGSKLNEGIDCNVRIIITEIDTTHIDSNDCIPRLTKNRINDIFKYFKAKFNSIRGDCFSPIVHYNDITNRLRNLGDYYEWLGQKANHNRAPHDLLFTLKICRTKDGGSSFLHLTISNTINSKIYDKISYEFPDVSKSTWDEMSFWKKQINRFLEKEINAFQTRENGKNYRGLIGLRDLILDLKKCPSCETTPVELKITNPNGIKCNPKLDFGKNYEEQN